MHSLQAAYLLLGLCLERGSSGRSPSGLSFESHFCINHQTSDAVDAGSDFFFSRMVLNGEEAPALEGIGITGGGKLVGPTPH